MNKPKVQIFILTYNRPELLKKSLLSVIDQDYNNIEIIVSDNSTNNDTENIMLEFIGQEGLKYVKREAVLAPISHFNTVLSEVSEEYFMMFHDDDTMNNEMVGELLSEIYNDSTVAAVGANAFKYKKGKKSRSLMNRKIKEKKIVKNRNEFIGSYLNFGGVIPFPAYLYRHSLVKGLEMNDKICGKYSDTSFLMEVADKGKIIQLEKPLMSYYYHRGQDSANDSFLDRLRLINLITNTTSLTNTTKEIRVFRLFNIFREFRLRTLKKERNFNLKFYLKLLRISFWVSPYAIFPRCLFLLIEINRGRK